MNANLIHELDLYRVGGVEQLFVRFIQASQTFKQHLLLHSARPHPFFEEALQQSVASFSHAKKFWGLRLPKFLRPFNISRILQQKKADRLICWNCVSNLQKGPKMRIYYEHGLANCFTQKKFSSYLKSFDRIISCSFSSKRVLELKWKVDAEHFVVNNPVRPETISAQAGPRSPSFMEGRESLRLGMVARLASVKAHALALHCVKSLKLQGLKVELYLAGEGELKESLITLAKTLQIEKSLHFLGNVQDISAFYQNIDLLLSFSIQESYGLSLVEAMANGCPVLAAATASPPIKSHGKSPAGQYCLLGKEQGCISLPVEIGLDDFRTLGGSVDQRTPSFVYDVQKDRIIEAKVIDPEKAAKQIAELFSKPDLYAEMSKAAFFYAKEHFSFAKFVQDLEKVISL